MQPEGGLTPGYQALQAGQCSALFGTHRSGVNHKNFIGGRIGFWEESVAPGSGRSLVRQVERQGRRSFLFVQGGIELIQAIMRDVPLFSKAPRDGTDNKLSIQELVCRIDLRRGLTQPDIHGAPELAAVVPHDGGNGQRL